MSKAIFITGLPASGKTSVARAIATQLGWPMLDKDDFLERLYDSTTVTTTEVRRRLSRQSDLEFQQAAQQLTHGVLVSHWRCRTGDSQSGTPTDWIAKHFDVVLELQCACPWQTAVTRFRSRQRHAGHLDALRSEASLKEQFQVLSQAQEQARPWALAPSSRLSVSTETRVDVQALAIKINLLLGL